jgi:tellurium resistance protein TerD
MGFNLEKGQKFSIEKSIKNFYIGVGWDKGAENVDVDLHVFGCVNPGSGPKFYGGASHAVTYANEDLKKSPDGSFGTADGSITHKGDNQTGAGDGDDEFAKVFSTKLPQEINEIAIFLTIHKALTRKQNFGKAKNAFIHVKNEDSGEELCRFSLQNQFPDAISVQVASFMKSDTGKWEFHALGAATPDKELGDILDVLS